MGPGILAGVILGLKIASGYFKRNYTTKEVSGCLWVFAVEKLMSKQGNGKGRPGDEK